MPIDKLTIKQGSAHDTPQEAKVNQMIVWARNACANRKRAV
jgi:hypothetical protein